MDPVTPAPAPATPPTTPVTPVAAPAPATGGWPGAFGIFKAARTAAMLNIGTLLPLFIISGIFGVISGFATNHSTVSGVATATSTPLSNGLSLIGTLIGILLAGATTTALLASARGHKISLGEAWPYGPKFAVRSLVLSIVTFLTVFGGLILLIVPGVIFAIRLTLAPYFMVDQNMSAMDAYKASWRATKGDTGKIWGLIGVSILMGLLFIIPILGWIAGAVLLYFYSPAYAMVYEYYKAKPVA